MKAVQLELALGYPMPDPKLGFARPPLHRQIERETQLLLDALARLRLARWQRRLKP